jgi:protein-tyrosine phosphatase
VVIDLHCHVLPDIDDGPRTLEDALQLCRDAFDAGTRTMIATPHVNWDYPEVTAGAIQARLKVLEEALRTARIELQVGAGAEVALSRAGELSDQELRALRLGSGPSLLLELPWSTSAAGVPQAVETLLGRGFGILLAHPERTPMLRDRPELVGALVEAGARCCLNASSLTRGAGRATRSAARRLLTEGLIHVIASDCHDAVRRGPQLGSMCRDAGLSPDDIDYFTVRSPGAVLGGQDIEPPPRITVRSPGRFIERLRR